MHPSAQTLVDNKSPVVLAHWHGDELALTYLVKRLKLATMTSTSKDGQIMDYVIRKLGGVTSKGSSTRGAVGALKGLIRYCKSGVPISMAVDGPKGPYHKVKPGAFELSKLCAAPVVPVGVAVSKAHVFERSWNKTFLPYPFAKVDIYFGEPFAPLSRDDDAKSLELAERLSSALLNAGAQAAKSIAAQ